MEKTQQSHLIRGDALYNQTKASLFLALNALLTAWKLVHGLAEKQNLLGLAKPHLHPTSKTNGLKHNEMWIMPQNPLAPRRVSHRCHPPLRPLLSVSGVYLHLREHGDNSAKSNKMTALRTSARVSVTHSLLGRESAAALRAIII